jgi:hypothetical protein
VTYETKVVYEEGFVPPSCLDVQEAWAITLFIERTLLPAINRMPADRAHCIMDAIDAILEEDKDCGESSAKSKASSSSKDDHDAMEVDAAVTMEKSAAPKPVLARVALVAARALKDAIHARGGLHRCAEDFRIHPKGTGVVVVLDEGIPAHEFVSEYIGELYPPWR